MPWSLPLLLLPLIGGYFFIHLTYITRFRAQGLSKYRLLFESAFAGMIWLLASYILIRVALRVNALPDDWLVAWKQYAPFSYGGTALGSLLLSFLVPLVINLAINRDRSVEFAVRRQGDDLMLLVAEAQKKTKEARQAEEARELVNEDGAPMDGTVMITLDNRKVYVGYVTLSRNLRPEMPYLVLLPTVSGYRDANTLEVHFTDRYTAVYRKIDAGEPPFDKLSARDFQIVIPTSSISAATPFSEYVPMDMFDGAVSTEPGKEA